MTPLWAAITSKRRLSHPTIFSKSWVHMDSVGSAPKNFPVENFRVRSDLQKSSIFHWFLLPPTKIKYQARVPTILMPQTFPIASLNRYTPNFSGVPQKLTWCQQFGLQIFPKWGDADICRLEMAVFRCFFGRNKFSRPNGRLLPIACHTYLESFMHQRSI